MNNPSIETLQTLGYGELAPILASRGYTPLPVQPGKKHPCITKWSRANEPAIVFPRGIKFCEPGELQTVNGDTFYPAPLYEQHLTNPAYAGFGSAILLGKPPYNLVCVDADIDDAEASEETLRRITDVYPELDEAVFKIGSLPRWSFILRSTVGFAKFTTPRTSIGCLEVLATGQQTILSAPHPNGNRYSFNKLPNADSLPELDIAEFHNISQIFQSVARDFNANFKIRNSQKFKKTEAENENKKLWVGATVQKTGKTANGWVWSQIGEMLVKDLGGGDPAGAKLKKIVCSVVKNNAPTGCKKYRWHAEDLAKQLAKIPWHYYGDYCFWFAFLCAMKGLKHPDKKKIAMKVSAAAPNWDWNSFHRTWEAIDRNPPEKPLTMGTIAFIASNVGSQPAVDVESVRKFAGERIAAGDGVLARELYEAYRRGVIDPVSQTAFGRTLKELGYKKKRTAQGVAYVGIRVIITAKSGVKRLGGMFGYRDVSELEWDRIVLRLNVLLATGPP